MSAGGEEQYRAVRSVVPPVRVRVWPGRIWPPSRVRFGAGTPLWQRAAGIRLSEPVLGELIEVVVTQAGDVVGRIVFEILVDRAPRTEVMLLPGSDMWEPIALVDRDRLRRLASEFGAAW